jgi:hypothetical protein
MIKEAIFAAVKIILTKNKKMKKVILAVFAVAILVASCGKEHKLNKRLDGEWNVTTVGGQALPSGYTSVMKFEKDKKGTGKFTWTSTDPSGTETETGTYDLDKDEKIYSTFTYAGITFMDTLLVVSYDKKSLKLSDAQSTASSVIEATKK